MTRDFELGTLTLTEIERRNGYRRWRVQFKTHWLFRWLEPSWDEVIVSRTSVYFQFESTFLFVPRWLDMALGGMVAKADYEKGTK